MRPGRPPVYPWAQWTDGEEHTVERGADFTCTPESFGVLLRRQARITPGLKVHVSVGPDTVWFQFVRETDAPTAAAS